MAISMFSSQVSPIVIDFGTAVVKLLQVAMGEKPALAAIAQIDVPDAIRTDQTKRIEFLTTELPKAMRKAKFRGRKVSFSIPSSRTFVTHLAVPANSSTSADDFVGMHLHAQTGMPPGKLVIRRTTVKPVFIDGVQHEETICFAVPRNVVMEHIELLKKCKLEVTDVHTEQHANVWAFNHIHKRKGDDQITNLFIDLGWGSTKVGVSHGRDLVFAKTITMAGRHFDQHLADTLNCDVSTARAHRIAAMETIVRERPRLAHAQGRGGTGSAILDTGMALSQEQDAPQAAVADDRRKDGLPVSLHVPAAGRASFAPEGINFDELLESIVDDLQMCVRYHRALFEERPIDRAIFLGGEARNTELCRAMARVLNIPAMVGDPLARLSLEEAPKQSILKPGQMMPGWAIACGLWSGLED